MRTNRPGSKTLIAIVIFFILVGTINLLISDKQVIEMGAYHRMSKVLSTGLIVVGSIILIVRFIRSSKI